MSNVDKGDESLEISNYESGSVCPDFAWELEMIPGFSTYLMSSHGKGGRLVCYIDEMK
jgi:hypothetical protein